MEPLRHPPDQIIRVRWDTYLALKRLREDQSYPTFDMVVREALKRQYSHLDL